MALFAVETHEALAGRNARSMRGSDMQKQAYITHERALYYITSKRDLPTLLLRSRACGCIQTRPSKRPSAAILLWQQGLQAAQARQTRMAAACLNLNKVAAACLNLKKAAKLMGGERRSVIDARTSQQRSRKEEEEEEERN